MSTLAKKLQKRWALLLTIILLGGLSVALPGLAEEPLPVQLEITPLKRIYSNREGVMVQFVFTARKRAKLCLAKDILSQMQVNIFKPGNGKLPLEPLVTKDHSVLFQERMKIHWLEPGESMTLRANLKRFHFADGKQWEPGEYNVNASFGLCPQTPDEVVTASDREINVPAANQGWFMIMM